MAITLLDELALEKQTLRKGVIQTLVESVMLQDRIPWETVGALQTTATYLSDIPTVPMRHLNEAATGSQAKFAQVAETLHIIDTDIDIDPVLLDNKNTVQNVEVAQTKAVVASLGYRVNDLFVNGNPTVDAREPRGIKVRLKEDVRFNGMTVNATGNAVELDCRPTAADADLLSWLNKLDQLLYLIGNGAMSATDLLIVNQQTVLSLWAGLRKLKLLDTTKDQFDREIPTYRGVPIVDVGYKPSGAIAGTPAASQANGDQIIPNDNDSYVTPENGNGANQYTNCSTIYAVRFGDEYLTGLQQTPMRVKPLGETEATPHYFRTNVRWVVSPAVPFQKRSMARLVGCAVSSAPA